MESTTSHPETTETKSGQSPKTPYQPDDLKGFYRRTNYIPPHLTPKKKVITAEHRRANFIPAAPKEDGPITSELSKKEESKASSMAQAVEESSARLEAARSAKSGLVKPELLAEGYTGEAVED